MAGRISSGRLRRTVASKGCDAHRQDGLEGIRSHPREILAAIDAGHLQYRVSSIHGNPWLRLLRQEVEVLMASTYNDTLHKQSGPRLSWLKSTRN
ncbi:MAG: hypothetical protein QOG44_3297 [Acidimicrobiaceae bacterium]|nr:hypothetical protein [Acidimicrobiaceae bacterium]